MSHPPILNPDTMADNQTSRLEWFAQLNPSKAPKTTEETKFHRKVRWDAEIFPRAQN